jgi:hypothetical protein
MLPVLQFLDEKVRMMMKTFMTIGLCAAAFSAQANAQTQPHRIAGYECMMLNISEQQAMDPNFHVVVKAAPSASSNTVGWQPDIVIVKMPGIATNGYLPILRANGHRAWIAASSVKPYHAEADPTAQCAPWVLPNGLIGSGPG